MKNKNIGFIIIVLVIVVGVGYLIFVNGGNYESLSKITNVDLNNLYIRGRNNGYNAMLNSLYGNSTKANKLSNGSTAHENYEYYDENGNKKLVITSLGNQYQVIIDKKEYIYKTTNSNKYEVKELYPDASKSDSEKLLSDIIKLYKDDKEYTWDYYSSKNHEDYPSNYKNGVKFYNEGITVTILDYDNNVIDKDLEKETQRLAHWNGAKLINTTNTSKGEIRFYKESNPIFTDTIIKNNNLLIIINYSRDYNHVDAKEKKEMNTNIDTLDKFLKDNNYLNK